MSRPPLEPIAVKAQPDIFTALLAIALAAVAIGVVILFLQAEALFPTQHLWS
jgi:hypothetical protein